MKINGNRLRLEIFWSERNEFMGWMFETGKSTAIG
jgi:hypothetical protein